MVIPATAEIQKNHLAGNVAHARVTSTIWIADAGSVMR